MGADPFRWLILAVLAACMTVSAVHRWKARRESGTIERRREGAVFLALRALVSLPLFGSVILAVVHPPALAWAVWPLPAWVRWSGAVLGGATVLLCYWVFTTLGANVSETVLTKADHRLVTGGPYRWVRHPLYTTGITLFLSIALMAGSWLILALAGVALILVLTVVIPAEERELLAKFGDDYRRMQGRTGRLLPRVF